MQKFIRINDWPFGLKIGASLVFFTAVPLLITSIILTSTTARELLDQQFAELEAIGEREANALETFLEERIADTDQLAARSFMRGNPEGDEGIAVISAFKDNRESDEFQYAYTRALSAMESLIEAKPYFTDLVIYDLEGDALVQTNADHVDPNAGNQEFFRKGLEGVFVTDIFRDEDSGEDAIFITRPLTNPAGDVVGVLSAELDLAELDALLINRTGLGATGETYIVGREGLMLSQSRFSETPTRLVQEVNTFGSREALEGRSGTEIYPDYRGISVLGDYRQVPLTGWAYLTEIDEAEALAQVRAQRLQTAISVVLAIAASVGLSYALARLFTRQINEARKVFRAAAIGNFDTRAEVYSQDELGEIATGVNSLLDYANDLLKGSQARMEGLVESASDAIVTVDADHNVVVFNSAAEEMFGVTADDVIGAPLSQFIPPRYRSGHGAHLRKYGRKQETARGMGRGAELAAVRADGTEFPVDANISQVMVGGEQFFSVILRDITDRKRFEAEVQEANRQLGDIVNHISRQAAVSAEMAARATSSASQGDQAVRETISAMERIRENTQETSRRLKRLGETSQEISEAVTLIEELADRTTVLALNASIQAAAAGDAGRGFAVVADEVQRLAERAVAASRQIENLVKTINSETNETVVGMEEATREVVDGSETAQTAGIEISQLNTLVSELAGLVQETSQIASRQTRGLTQQLPELASVTDSGHASEGNGAHYSYEKAAGD